LVSGINSRNTGKILNHEFISYLHTLLVRVGNHPEIIFSHRLHKAGVDKCGARFWAWAFAILIGGSLLTLYFYDQEELGCLLYVIIHLSIVLYLYTSAMKYGMSGLAWLFAGLFVALPALTVFWIIAYYMGMAQVARDSEDVAESIVYGQLSGIVPPSPSKAPDPDFRDDEIDNLISECKFDDAKEQLGKMLKVAREMHDEQAVMNYQQYENRIYEAERKHEGGR